MSTVIFDSLCFILFHLYIHIYIDIVVACDKATLRPIFRGCRWKDVRDDRDCLKHTHTYQSKHPWHVTRTRRATSYSSAHKYRNNAWTDPSFCIRTRIYLHAGVLDAHGRSYNLTWNPVSTFPIYVWICRRIRPNVLTECTCFRKCENYKPVKELFQGKITGSIIYKLTSKFFKNCRTKNILR